MHMLIIPLQVYEEYENRLQGLNSVDLDDLVLKTVHLVERMPQVAESVQHLFVDELQVRSAIFCFVCRSR